MARPVGAWGAGCGIAGLLSILLGVGLSVWLGSRVLDSTTGNGGPADRAREAAAGTIAVTPATGLTDGATVAIEGTGLPPGPARATVCLTNGPTDGGPLGTCDGSIQAPIEVAPDGRAIGQLAVPRAIRVIVTDYDCAAFDGACSVVVHRDDTLAGAAYAPLSFTTGLPTVPAVEPPRPS